MNTFKDTDGVSDDSLERFFAREFDEPICSLVREVGPQALSGNLRRITFEEKMFFVQFMYNHIKRTPDFHGKAEPDKALEEILQGMKIEARSLGVQFSDEVWQQVTTGTSKGRIIANARVKVLARQAEVILDAMAELNLVFATCDSRRTSFIIGSNPVVRLTNNHSLHLNTGDIELWTALTPALLLGLVRRPTATSLLQLSRDGVRHINIAVFKQSEAIGGLSKRQLESIVSNR